MAGMIDPAGMVRLISVRPEEVWHIVARDDGVIVTACAIELPGADGDRQSIPAESLLAAGRVCLTCAQALISAG